MECTELQSFLSEYTVGLIEGGRRAEIERHLGDCPACKIELEKLNKVMLLVEGLDAVEPPAGLWNGVYERIARPAPKESALDRVRHWFHGRRTGWSLGLAAAALVAIVFAAHMHNPGGQTAYAADEYIQGHAIYASQDLLADRAALNSIAAVAYREQVGDHK